MIQDAPKHSLQFGLLTAVCGVGAIVCTFATIRISQTVPYWTVVPSVLLLVSMRRDSDLVTSWGMIAMAMLVASVDFSWRLPGCFQFSGFLHRYELQTRIAELYLTSFSIPFSLAIPAIIRTVLHASPGQISFSS